MNKITEEQISETVLGLNMCITTAVSGECPNIERTFESFENTNKNIGYAASKMGVIPDYKTNPKASDVQWVNREIAIDVIKSYRKEGRDYFRKYQAKKAEGRKVKDSQTKLDISETPKQPLLPSSACSVQSDVPGAPTNEVTVSSDREEIINKLDRLDEIQDEISILRKDYTSMLKSSLV